MRLIRWASEQTRHFLEEDRLSNIFSHLDILKMTEQDMVPDQCPEDL